MKTEIYKGKKVLKSLTVWVLDEGNGKESYTIDAHDMSAFEMVGVGEFVRFRGLMNVAPIKPADKKEKDA